MRFRERLALAIFLAPIILGVIFFALGKVDNPHWQLGEFILGGAMFGALFGGSAWVCVATLVWVFTGRA